MLEARAACGGPVERVRPNPVGLALISGVSSSGSGGGGVGSLGGGVGSRFLRIGYLFGSGCDAGVSFSFVASLGLLRRSRELNEPFESGDGASLEDAAAAAFLRRSSASLASLEEPPRSLG